MTRITVEKVEDRFTLYCKYSGQLQPQPAYIGLDVGGMLSAYYSSKSLDTWAWSVSPYLKKESINQILGAVAPLAQKLLDADDRDEPEEVEEMRAEIEKQIERETDRFDGSNYFSLMSATEYFEDFHDQILQKLEDGGIEAAKELFEDGGLLDLSELEDEEGVLLEEDIEDMLEAMKESLSNPEEYIVREPGCSAWEDGMETLEEAKESQKKAFMCRGFGKAIIVKKVEFGGGDYTVIVNTKERK